MNGCSICFGDGISIVCLYEKFGKDDGGTNQVLSWPRSQDDVPILSAPLISFLQHLRIQQVALQDVKVRQYSLVGIANQLGRWIHLDEEDRHVIVMCGMSAAFSALFGTPWPQLCVYFGSCECWSYMYYTAPMPPNV